MSPRDFSGVFSRQFVVGHYLPALFALAVAAVAATDDWLPGAFKESGDLIDKLLILGIVAFPVGLLLSSAHSHLLRIFTGEARELIAVKRGLEPQGRWDRLKSRIGGPRLDRRYREKKRDWQDRMEGWGDENSRRRSNPVGALDFSQELPLKKEWILPTKLGNAVRAFQTHADARYGLDGKAAWPHIELLMDDDERRLVDDARTDVIFFLNCMLCTVLVASALAVDFAAALFDGFTWSQLIGLVVALVAGILLFFLFRLNAGTAAYRWGMPVRAAVDLHRLELYEHLGLRPPGGPGEEGNTAAAVNDLLLRAKPVPPELWTKGDGK